MGTTRATLRRTIGRLCGDLIVATATADATTSTTFTDTVNLVAGDDALIGRQAFYASASVANAANLYTTRRVSDNTESTGTITVSTAWSAAPDIGDVLELFSSRSVSPSPEEIHDKINDLIRAVSDQNLVLTDSTAAEFDATNSPYIDVPSTWIGVTGVQWQDSLSIWHQVPRANWKLHRSLGTYGQIELINEARWQADGYQTQLLGVTPAAVLTSDTTSTIINPDWLSKQAAGELLIQNARAYDDTAGAERRGNLYLQMAAALLPKASTRPPAGYVRTNRQ